jgi:hypothetical protein
MRYELWKTRLRKSRTNIEIAKPAAPAQAVLTRHWLQSSHAVRGSQKTIASGTKG